MRSKIQETSSKSPPSDTRDEETGQEGTSTGSKEKQEVAIGATRDHGDAERTSPSEESHEKRGWAATAARRSGRLSSRRGVGAEQGPTSELTEVESECKEGSINGPSSSPLADDLGQQQQMEEEEEEDTTASFVPSVPYSEDWEVPSPGVIRVAGMNSGNQTPPSEEFSSDSNDVVEAEVVQHHVVPTAYLVENDSEQVLRDERERNAERERDLENRLSRLEEENTRRRKKAWLFVRLGLVLLLVGGVSVALGLILSADRRENDATAAPSSPPTESPTSFPSQSPTLPPSPECFNTSQQLRDAVDDLLLGADGNGADAGSPNDWCVSRITTFSNLFSVDRNSQAQFFDKGIVEWDMSSAVDTTSMFNGAKFFNRDLSRWDVASVNTMRSMFNEASEFNQDLSRWAVGNVKDMSSMFRLASAFNQNISTWDVSSVTDMGYMFVGASAFNTDISEWRVGNVRDMDLTFWNCVSFNQDVSRWDVSQVQTMRSLFSKARKFNQDVSKWDVSRVTSLRATFANAAPFHQNLSAWDVSKVQDLSFMFESTSFDYDISSWDVSSVEEMRAMFFSATAFNKDLSTWAVSKVVTFERMFWGASRFNRSLCAWGPLVQKNANVVGMFNGTACPITDDPNLLADPPGPFCFECRG